VNAFTLDVSDSVSSNSTSFDSRSSDRVSSDPAVGDSERALIRDFRKLALAAQRKCGLLPATLVGIDDAALKAAGGAWPPDELKPAKAVPTHMRRRLRVECVGSDSRGFERVVGSGVL
jgi:hypothetical protein